MRSAVATQQVPPRVWVWIDVAATCNLNCALCYTTAMRSRQKMSLPLFRTVIARVADSSARLVKLHVNWRGEPTSNPALPEMIAHTARRLPGVEIEWHTNGTLVRGGLARALVDASPNQKIYVSIDGGTRESFERARGAGTWPRALRGLEALLDARGAASLPRIGVYQLDLGVRPEDYDARFVELLGAVDEHRRMAPVATDGGEVGALGPVPRGPCFWLGHALAIDVFGAAHTCLLEPGTRLGSLLEHDVDELLARAGDLRARVVRGGRGQVPGCSGCRKCAGGPEPGDV